MFRPITSACFRPGIKQIDVAEFVRILTFAGQISSVWIG